MTSRRAGASAVVLTVAAVGLMLLMIMFAARSGPQRIIHGTLVDPTLPPVQLTGVFPSITGQGGHHRSQGVLHDNPVFQALGLLLKVALAAVVVWVLWRGWLRLRDLVVARRRPAPPPEAVDFDVLDDPQPLADEMRDDAADQLALLLDGSPRNAIVACWDRFEEQAERVHASRQPWETSSEFILRLLDAVSADAAAVTRLELLYREARFSTHEIDEVRREAAVEALEAIHASLGVRAVR
jgi:hypothetical protein